jgi:hypothetical protein
VAPGRLAWVFPSLRTALAAVFAMRKNVVRWAVVVGRDLDLDVARATGMLLAEQTSA